MKLSINFKRLILIQITYIPSIDFFDITSFRNNRMTFICVFYERLKSINFFIYFPTFFN